MRHEIKLPKLGDMTEEVVVLAWLRAVGEHVDEGDGFLLVETDKATVELPAPMAGVLVEQLVAVDDEVATGDPVCVLES